MKILLLAMLLLTLNACPSQIFLDKVQQEDCRNIAAHPREDDKDRSGTRACIEQDASTRSTSPGTPGPR